MVIGLVIAVVLACAAAGVVAFLIVRNRKASAKVEQLERGLVSGSELAASLNPDDVFDRTLDAVVGMTGVDAALIVIGDDPATWSTRAAGLTDDEIERTLLQMPTHSDLRTLEVVYRYRLEDVAQSSRLPRAALTVMLRADGETVGSLAAISRARVPSFPDATVDALERLAARAGPAISNAIRFTEAREHAEFDSLTGLH